jgi:hypothetical protein
VNSLTADSQDSKDVISLVLTGPGGRVRETITYQVLESGVQLKIEGDSHAKHVVTYTPQVINDNLYSLKKPFQMILAALAMDPIPTLDDVELYAEEGLMDCRVSLSMFRPKPELENRSVRLLSCSDECELRHFCGRTSETELRRFATDVLEKIFPGNPD